MGEGKDMRGDWGRKPGCRYILGFGECVLWPCLALSGMPSWGREGGRYRGLCCIIGENMRVSD